MAITPITAKRELYSDFARDMRIHPLTKDLARKTNEESVKESIRNIIMTNKGERPFQPNFGCDIRKMLFDNFTQQTSLLVDKIIRSAIIRYEPRADVTDVRISPVSKNLSQRVAGKQLLFSDTFAVAIQFYVVNLIDPVSLELIMTRIR